MKVKRHVTKKDGEVEHPRTSLEHDRAAQPAVENSMRNLEVTNIGKSERRPLSKKKRKGGDGR